MQYQRNIKTARDVRNFVEQLGGVLVEAHVTKHWKVTALFEGRVVKTTLAISPSDHRTRIFEATRIRRMARGHYKECGWISLAG